MEEMLKRKRHRQTRERFELPQAGPLCKVGTIWNIFVDKQTNISYNTIIEENFNKKLVKAQGLCLWLTRKGWVSPMQR